MLHGLEAAGHPHQGVETKHQEGPDQQHGHEQPGVVDDRILVLVVVGGVGQVSGELPMSARMTLGACTHDVIARQGRSRVVRFENVVLPVAIMATGCFGVTQGEDLAVIGLEIGFGYTFMAHTAGVGDLQLEALGVDTGNLVGAVAVVAHGQHVAVLVLAREVDTPTKSPVDALVAPATGVGHLGSVDGRAGILAGQDGVCRVAIDAGRRHHQSALFQRLTVHTLLVVGHHAFRGAFVALVGDAARVVADPAQIGNIPDVGSGFRIVLLENIVAAVADQAIRSVRVTLLFHLAVDAVLVDLHHFGMADRAVDAAGNGVAGPFMVDRSPGVALDAGSLPVGGPAKNLVVHEHGLALGTWPRAREFSLLVADQTLAVGHALVVIDPPDFMGLVAFDADRNLGRILFPQISLDDLPMHLLDQSVALFAGGRHVVAVNT